MAKKSKPIKKKTPIKDPPNKADSKRIVRKSQVSSSPGLPTKWIRDLKSQDPPIGSAARAEEIEKVGARLLNSDNLKKLNYDELKEVYQTFDDIDEETSKSIVLSILQMTQKPSIEKAKLGHRIWSYFYEKIPIRLFILLWFFLAAKLKTLISYWLFTVDPDSLSQIPSLLVNFIFLESKALSLGMLIAIALLFAVWIFWRLWVAWSESNANFKHPGSTHFRQNLGLIVVNKRGKPINPLFSFLRGLFRVFPLSLISVISMEFSRSGRGIHDLLFNTYVLRIYRDLSHEEIAYFIRENY